VAQNKIHKQKCAFHRAVTRLTLLSI